VETAGILIGIVIGLAGLAGCIVPGIPGPPLNYVALLFVQWAARPFSVAVLAGWAVITVVVTALDYWLPVWTARRFGATRQGILGSIIGMVIGMFMTPVGMLAGLVIGAILGDLAAGRSHGQAARSGLATAFGTLLTIGIKLVASGAMFYLVIRSAARAWL